MFSNFIPSFLSLGRGGEQITQGGEKSDELKISFGFALMRGKRMGMEDFHHAGFRRDPKTGQAVGLFGVYDGHGGPHCAEFVKMNYFNNLLKHPKFGTDMTTAIVETFIQTDNQYLEQDASKDRDDGCTAVIAVVLGRKLFVAHVGDSRAVLSRAGKGIALSLDHKPNRSDERERIENAGGIVVWAGTWRVGGVLAVSRAFGDRFLKRYVVAHPEVAEELIGPEDDCLILASDGVWDVVQNQEAVAMVRNIDDAEAAAKKVAEDAYHRGSNDNISVICIKFNRS